VTPDDQVKPSAVTGGPAARIKELICAGAGWSVSHPTVLLPTRRRRVAPAGGGARTGAQTRTDTPTPPRVSAP